MGLAKFRREERGLNGGLDSVSLYGFDNDVLRTFTGVSVSQAQALALTAVYSAVRTIADPISTFPIGTFVREGGERKPLYPRPRWVDTPEPDPAIGRSDHYQALMVSLLLNGNYYGRKIRVNGEVLAITAIDPTTIEPQRNELTGLVEFRTRGGVLPSSEVIHITDLRKPGAIKGTSRIDELRQTFGIGKALDEYVARYFSQGTTSSLFITTPAETTEDQAERMKARVEDRWTGTKNAHRPNVLSGGADIKRLGDSAKDSQLTEAREFFVLETARAFKIPPSQLAVTTEGTRSYASVEQDNIDFASKTLTFYVNKIEEAYSPLLDRPGGFIKLNMNALLRGDMTSRFGAYAQAIDAGWMSINDIHRLEDLPAVPGGDEYRVPLENINLPAANVVETQKNVEMAVALIATGKFDAADVLAKFNLPPIETIDTPEPPDDEPPAAALVAA